MSEEITGRTALLIGQSGVDRLKNSRVAVIGLGGVGGHCAEALARAGVGKLHLVDTDTVALSNLNRQCFATFSTVGMKKTEAAALRLREVSNAQLTFSETFVLPGTVSAALPGEFDFVVDAIDTLSGKVAVALWCREHGVPLISCLGAGNRFDPGRFQVTDLAKTAGCPLARAFRHALRKEGIEHLTVVFSDEPAKRGEGQTVIGSLAPVTAAAGLQAAAYVIRSLVL